MLDLPLVIDFDGTIAENIWETDPEGIGEPIQPVIKALRNAALKERIIIVTARPAMHEERIVKWLNRHRVPYEHIEFHKRIAKWYVDDKAMTPDMFIDYYGED